MIPQEEQDTHELLHVILSSLEEEATKPKKIGCLSDALGDIDTLSKDNMPPPRPSSAMLSDFCNPEYDESTNFMRYARSEAHTPDSPHSTCTDMDESLDNSLLDEALATSPPSLMSTISLRQSRPRTISTSMGNGGPSSMLNKRQSGSCRSLERLSRGPGRISIYSEKATIQVPHPFSGGLSSQLVCSGCGYKSVVRYDKFDSITLSLPETKKPGLSLGHLLSEFIAFESLNDVKCESCNETTTHTKSVTFGKVSIPI